MHVRDGLTTLIAVVSRLSEYVPSCNVRISCNNIQLSGIDRARKKDFIAIEHMKKVDGEALHAAAREHEISMCGSGPVTAGLHALKKMGASSAELVAYANSGDTSGDYSAVVGYAGLLIR